jgi:septal ring factor EnvC (AmiA/AmiB activator)
VKALAAQSEPLPDMSHAVPAGQISKLPSTAQQFQVLKKEIVKDRPAVASAKEKSDALKAEALALREKLIATAARVEELEAEKTTLDADIVRLAAEDRTLSASFAHDRVAVIHLLAIMERLQHDMPPAMALRPDDALGAARGAMLIGASLPSVYGQAAALARRIDTLHNTRLALIAGRAEGVRNAAQLTQARSDLDQLLAMKELEADAAASEYGLLKTRLDTAAVQAGDLAALLARIAQLRAQPSQKNIVVVTAQKGDVGGFLHKGSLLRPVVGRLVPGGMEGIGGDRAPGLTFATAPGAQVIAPADGEVLFAGPYHKSGQVLILEMTAGYDVVLAGLDRINVKPGYQLLAGEPVGTMPKINQDVRLYFELRQNGHGVSPAPWLALELRKAQRT